MLNTILTIGQIAIAIILILLILMQAQGTGLSITFGGQGGVYRSKRGIEKTIFFATIFFAIVFFATTIALLLFSK